MNVGGAITSTWTSWDVVDKGSDLAIHTLAMVKTLLLKLPKIPQEQNGRSAPVKNAPAAKAPAKKATVKKQDHILKRLKFQKITEL